LEKEPNSGNLASWLPTFDKINHKTLLEKLHTSPTIRRQIRAWLRSGVIDFSLYSLNEKSYSRTFEGTPQGGVISPLLANIALNGMENRIKQAFPKRQPTINGKRIVIPSPELIRYADDFVILHEDLTVIQQCQQIISEWLKGLGLELKPSKTRISHTLNEYLGNVGFDFLGFTIRQFPAGKCHSGKSTNGKLLGYKTIIKPSQEKLQAHTVKLGKLMDRHQASKQAVLISNLNPVIRGWANYYTSVCSNRTFSKVDAIIFSQLKSWVKRRHPDKPFKWIRKKYWHTIGNNNWVFQPPEYSPKLIRHTDTKSTKHIKVQGNRSPYDGDWIYWSSRMGKHPEAPTRISKLLRVQKGKCSYCELYFKDGDLLEIDHIIPSSQGGKNGYDNWQLLHRHCHDVKTAKDKLQIQPEVIDEDYLVDNPF
ncbi:reverse transcriptase domain-containing protein, partial [Nostoc sp. 106C]|uniref:group II intron reverse transcriptase n=1 Tax=Nostoc sp. 106C TaxID=1932667 RepID=UPI000B632E96